MRRAPEPAGLTRARRAADPRLAELLPRGLVGYLHEHVGFGAWLEPPRPELTLMVDLEGSISADGRALPGAWVGGLSDAPTVVGLGGERYGSIDLKLDPVAAHALVGAPLAELEGACVPLEDVFGAAATELTERVREAPGWDERFDLVEAFLLARLPEGPRVDPAVAWAWRRLRDTSGRIRVGALAAEVGCSHRHLSARFSSQLGVGIKTAARLWRLWEVRRRIEDSPGAWADVAYEAGFADQAHLVREFRQLTGVTPTEFVARLLPQGGVAGDGL